ncbi:MAG TPA: hypothetical protein VKV05_10365 [Terriglobales bacterium]|nr:hypothetical protein [Terriglobales bacterium]
MALLIAAWLSRPLQRNSGAACLKRDNFLASAGAFFRLVLRYLTALKSANPGGLLFYCWPEASEAFESFHFSRAHL